MNRRSLRFVLICALASLLVALIAHQNMIRRGWDSDAIKVGVPIAGYSSDINDNYLYFSLIKRGANACRSPADEQEIDASGNPLACTYVPAIVVDNLIYKAIRILSPDRATALGALLVLQTGLLAFAALVFIQQLVQRRLGGLAALGIAGGIIFLSDAFSWSLRFRTFYTNLPYIWQYEPNVVRLVSPTVYWTLGLLALTSLLALMNKPNPWRYSVAGVLLALCSASSIAVGTNIGAGVGLAFVGVAIWYRRIDFPLLFAGVMLIIGLAWQEWFFSRFYNTEFGAQLGHGSFIGLHFDPFYMILLVPAFLGRIGDLKGPRQILLRSLLVGSILMGAFSESVELGDRLWLRGATMIALVLTIAWVISTAVRAWPLLRIAGGAVAQLRKGWMSRAAVAVACLALTSTLIAVSGWARPYDPQRWYGVVENDRFEAIDWIAANTKPGDTVASGNIDDTNLIEFYTDATAFVGLFGMSALPFDELLRRYLFIVDLQTRRDQIFALLKLAKQSDLTDFFTYVDSSPKAAYDQNKYQVVGFYELLVYHSYNAAVPRLFASGNVDPAFVQRLIRLRGEASKRSYTFKYLLLRVTDQLQSPNAFQEVFRNAHYIIYAPERTDRAVSQ